MDFNDYTKEELAKLAERRNIQVPNNAAKAVLIEALEGAGPDEEDFYRDKTYLSIAEHADRRGIPAEEVPKVIEAGEAKLGMTLKMAHYGQLKRFNRELPHILTEYLGGRKRRPIPGRKLPAGFPG